MIFVKTPNKSVPLNVQPTAAPMQDRSLVNLRINQGIVTFMDYCQNFGEVSCSSKKIQMTKELCFFNHLCKYFSENDNNKSIYCLQFAKQFFLFSSPFPYLPFRHHDSARFWLISLQPVFPERRRESRVETCIGFPVISIGG